MLSNSFSTDMVKKFHSMKLHDQSRNLWCKIYQHNIYFLRAVILWLTALFWKVLCQTVHKGKALQKFTILTKRVSLLIIEIVSSTSVLIPLPQSHQLDCRRSSWFVWKKLSSQPSSPRSPKYLHDAMLHITICHRMAGGACKCQVQ